MFKNATDYAAELKASDWDTTPNTVLLARAKAAFPTAPAAYWNDVRIELNKLDGIEEDAR